MNSLIEWHPSQGQGRVKSYFLLTCAASRPQNLHTNCLYSSELSKWRSPSLIFPAGNMKRNLFACRKGHKGMSNMISGILLQCVKTLGMLFFDLCQGPIISSHCVPVKVHQCVKCESFCRECADGFRGQTGSTVVLSACFWWMGSVCSHEPAFLQNTSWNNAAWSPWAGWVVVLF